MKIVNLIHIGDKVKNFDEMNPEEKCRIAIALNIQALQPLGYDVSSAKDMLNKLEIGVKRSDGKD